MGAESYKSKNNHVPVGKTLLYHLKKYDSIYEIQRAYEIIYEAIWLLARKSNLFDPRKKVDLAIDYTDWLFYGNRKAKMVVGTQPKDGTDRCYKFATVNIVEPGKRFTLLALPVGALDKKEEILSHLLRYALRRVKINKVYFDKGFFHAKSIKVLNDLRLKWIMPAQRNYRIKRILDITPPSTVVTDYDMLESSFNLCVGIGRNGEKQIFATNLQLTNDEARFVHWLFDCYSHRWGIETSFRVMKHFYRPKTTSKNYRIRLFYFLFSVVMYNLWILANALVWLYLHGFIGSKPLLKAVLFSDKFLTIDPGG